MSANPELTIAMNAGLLIEHGCEEGLAGRAARQFQEKCERVAKLEEAVRRAHEWLTTSVPTLERRAFQATGILANVLPATPSDLGREQAGQ